MPLRLALSLLAASVLCACATVAPETRWAPRDDASLETDRVACRDEANRVDMQAVGDYSGRYGAAAAMAGRLNETDLRGGGEARVYAAVHDACMIRKGWTRAE